ncbi:unnamed protein product [Ilex paraguariensis]|uniref:Uncharacterized protein n=1 Tax=Ilex paraguariensis TaxID=185542 RepID=A0ABC8U2U4_9AQUA
MRASVEVKPILYVAENVGTESDHILPELASKTAQSYWGFQHEDWHDICLQECVVNGKICAVILSVTDQLAAKVCSKSAGINQDDMDHKTLITGEQMERIARFCIYRLDYFLLENSLSWDDVTNSPPQYSKSPDFHGDSFCGPKNLRFYFATGLHISHGTLSLIFTHAFKEFSDMSQRIKIHKEPIFNLVPVLGAGSSAASIDDIITCELFASKS